MKIAYLMHTYRDFDEVVETIKQLTMQGDHVFLMINDNDLRDKVYFTYSGSPKLHISHIQEYAQEGDLSLARGTILQLKEAYELETDNFDYYINLTDGMMPIKSRTEIVEYLENNPGNYYYVDHDDTNDKKLNKRVNAPYVLTNTELCIRSKFVRGMTVGGASLYYALGARKKNADKKFVGSPYFILNNDAAKVLVDNYAYVSQTFKYSWYAEEMYIPMMFYKFDTLDGHINKDMRALGPNGSWTPLHAPKEITREVIDANKDALFAGAILADENPSLYEDYFDIYNRDYEGEEINKDKNKEIPDPLVIMEALNQKNRDLYEED